MTICNMTIFSKTAKYEYLQYEYFSKKIVIFDFKNMTNKKHMTHYEVDTRLFGANVLSLSGFLSRKNI